MLTVPVVLIDAATLARQLDTDDPPVVADVRWSLAGPPGLRSYLDGHIPGAVFVDLDADLCGPPGAGGRHPLPEPEAVARALRAAGVRTGHPVVVYDGGDGMAAARLWWTLRWAGHEQVSVLDGGLPAWVDLGGRVIPGDDDTRHNVRPGDITVRPGCLQVLDADEAAQLAATGVLLDVRAPQRFRGETEPIDAVAGHIPGAVNLPLGELTHPDGRLRSPAQLRRAFTDSGVRPDLPVGVYCGSGVTAALVILAMHHADMTDAALYVGSWSHWITDPTRPVATDPSIGGL